MSLISVAILPHSPLLVPTVGKDNIQTVKNTVDDINKIIKSFKDLEIDTVIIISTHNSVFDDAYIINHCQNFKADFNEFGDLVTDLNFVSDMELSYKIKEKLESKKQVVLACEEKLDYSIAVPLYYLKKFLPNVSIIPIHTSKLSWQDHFEFGQSIRSVIDDSSKKIGVITVGDLSHSVNKNTSTDNNSIGKEYDNSLIKFIKSNDSQNILNFSKELVENSEECIFMSLLILMGILDETKFESEILSYESPFGVGLLVAKLNL